MEIKNKESELVFYFVDVQTNQTKESKEDDKQKIEQKKKNNISIEEHIDYSLNELVYNIFHVCVEYKKGERCYVINDLQMNLIVNEVEWHGEFNKYILKKEVKLQSREVLLLYQVFVTRILYMILINHNDNLADYVKTNDLKLKFDVLCDEFVKSISDFKTNEDALNFLFDKMLDTENCVDKNKNDNGINEMKHEILNCVKNLLENENDDSKESCEFKFCSSSDKNKEVKTSSCFIASCESKIYDLKKYDFKINEINVNNSYNSCDSKIYNSCDSKINESDEDENYESKSCKDKKDEFEVEFKNEKTKWSKDLGKEISLRQTEKIKMQNGIDYNKLKPIGDLLENNKNHLDAIWQSKYEGEKEINDKTPISYRMLLPYLDKENENADRNFEAILNYYIGNEWQSKYLNSIIKVGIRSFEEIFMPNSVLKEYWTQKIIYPENTLLLNEKPKDNFEKLIKNLKKKGFYISYWKFGIFKYKDEDGNFYTHHFALENLGDFCEIKQIVDNCEYDDKYRMIVNEIKIKPEYENDFRDIKIKPNTFSRTTLIKSLAERLGGHWFDETMYQKDILNQLYYQCLKLIPIEQLLKTEIYDNTKIRYLCDFDMLNDINDKCENIEQMTKQIMKEAMIKNNAIKMDENNQLDCFGFGKLDTKEKDDYIEKDYNYYNIFEGNNLFEIMSKKLKDETIKIRSDNHEVIKAIFKTFKFKFDAFDNRKNYFSQCCDLVKELCAKYEDEKEFITCELFGTMLDHIIDRSSDYYIGNYAKILFQLDDSSNNKKYKFTTEQQIGFLKLWIDKLNNENEENKNNLGTEYQLREVCEIMIQQNTSVKLDQKVIDCLFLNINDAKYLNSLLVQIGYKRYKFSLSLNVVERMLDLFINDKNLQDDTKQSYLFNFVRSIILNDNINFISDDKKQIDEIKELKEEQRQIRLNFIKMCLEKINGNKKLIAAYDLNFVFKYFDDSLETKKEIANKIIDCGFRFDLSGRVRILGKTKEEDQDKLEEILSKWEKEEKKESESKISKIEEEKKKEEEDKNSDKKANGISDGDIFTNKVDSENIANIKNEIKTTESQIYPQKDISPTEQTQKESFLNWSIYFAIALIVAIVILTFVFKEPLILSALLAPIIIFVYRCVKRCKKNNSQQEKPNLKTNDKDGKTSLLDKTQNMNLMVSKQDEKIILDEHTNVQGVQGYIDNLDSLNKN